MVEASVRGLRVMVYCNSTVSSIDQPSDSPRQCDYVWL